MRRTASIVVAAIAVLEAALLVQQAFATDSVDPFSRFFGLSMVGFLSVGAYSVLRRPRHRVGWALVGIGVGVQTAILGEAYLIPLLPEGASSYLFILSQPLLVGGYALIAFFLLWYPTGDLSSPRWRWVERAITVLILVHMVYYGLRPGDLSATGVDNPIGLDFLGALRDGPVENTAGFLLALLVVACLGSLVMRYREGSWTVRQQIRLILYPALALVVTYTIAIVLDEALGPELFNYMFYLLPFLGFNAIAFGVGVAIARYRLYEIDRIISRTLSYALVVGLLALVFAAGVVWIPRAFNLGDSPLLVAASTLAVAALFNPLRRRIQTWVDRRFNRSRYDAERVMDDFAGSLRDRIDPDGVVGGWVEVVSDTMQPTSVGVWVRE